MIKRRMFQLMVMLLTFLYITFSGCGGGGGDSSNQVPLGPSPSIKASPSTYDFGIVTPGNSPSPLTAEISNIGSATLNVSSISLIDNNNFVLNLEGGTNPCKTENPTLTAGSKCTVNIDFQPQSITSSPTTLYTTALKINSNDPKTPTFNLQLSGRQEEISALNVRINQVIINCASRQVDAYVSVTDQGGYPVTTLGINDFSISETGTGGKSDIPPTNAPFLDSTASISTAFVLDYSMSVGSAAIEDMVAATSLFVDQMRDTDDAEIIKFSDHFEVVQPWTSDKILLKEIFNKPWSGGEGSVVYDSVMQAIEDTAGTSNDRKAVILISDGLDLNTSGSRASSATLDNVIINANSKNVPIFTIGSGSNVQVDDLKNMADKTGGQYYNAATSDNLKTIQQQLASVLFTYQYLITYTTNLDNGTNTDLTIEATLSNATGNFTKGITVCPLP